MFALFILLPFSYLHEKNVKFDFWFDFCFTALQHILGHFGRGQLT